MPPNPRILIIPIIGGWQYLPPGQLLGLTEDLEELDAARALAESLGRTNCLFALGNADEIPWRDQFFDVAYLSGSATPEVRRVMAPQGVIHECQSTFSSPQ